jgi:type I restriction enzyme M protein
MFLKFLDDMEQIAEQEADLAGTPFRPTITPPYRWRDWGAGGQGITGDDLLAFVNQDEAMRPDGKRGPGLLAYLRGLQSQNGRDRRDVLANVFRGVTNRMVNGYLLRDVINLVDGIHFTASDEIHTLSHLYESMLRELRDAAGDSGEIYTPRPVVRFMVQVVDPRLGETMLDPAVGTGGFCVETYEHLKPQAATVEGRRVLQERSIYGQEAKPLPYLLAQMNLLLHGLEYPNIALGNSLAVKLSEIGDRERVDVILTNPPFGGEEETGIKANFPEDKQTAETALLFMQLIMRKLKRPTGGKGGGRAGVVVPNGTLFADGVAARIKAELLADFNLHTIVRLPNGVFAPYTSIPTNLLFFDRSGPTREIWYYELPLPEGRKQYTKTKPIQYEDFADCLAWYQSTPRQENERAWCVPVGDVLQYDEKGGLLSANLDVKNPHASEALEHMAPEQLVADIVAKERRILDLMREIEAELAGGVG